MFHLDSKNEAKISEKIQHLSMTRVMIAHRQETIEKAEKIFELVNGNLINVNEKYTKMAN